MPDLTNRETWADEDLVALLDRVHAEQQRRWTLDNARAEADRLAQQYQEASGRADGDPWQQPQGAYDAYRMDAVASHAGKVWVSIIPNNMHRPGSSGWLEVAQ